MTIRIIGIAALAATLLLAACSGGGEGTAGTNTATTLTPALPAPRAADVALAPIRRDGRDLQVGTETSPVRSLSPVSGRPGTSWGRVRDGAGRADVQRYIEQTLLEGFWYPDGDLLTLPERGEPAPLYRSLRRFPSPPSIHIAADARPDQIDTVVRGVQLFNEALPPAWHIRIGSQAPAYTPGEQPRPPHEQIHVVFAPQELWPDDFRHFDRVAGLAQSGREWSADTGYSIYANIWINTSATSGDDMLHVFVHELLHALGFIDHVTGLESVLNQDSPEYRLPALFPVDSEALRAAYMHLDFGDDPSAVHTKLADWSDTSTHLAGRAGAAHFGAAHRNGFVRPWATGPAPRRSLADGPLSGSVAWNGELLGFTPTGAPVAGDAAIGVDLSTLDGTASFESLETWTAGTPPGAPGTGTMWGDGDLDYGIAVHGNTFRRTSGDAGVLTGIFVGAGHEGAAGTLERDDLSAGFGATRE